MSERHNLARGANEWADTYGSLGATAPAQLTEKATQAPFFRYGVKSPI